jgi:hypothetical protein
MDGIAVYLLIGNSQLVFCYPELYGGDGGGGGGGVHDTPCVLGLFFYYCAEHRIATRQVTVPQRIELR